MSGVTEYTDMMQRVILLLVVAAVGAMVLGGCGRHARSEVPISGVPLQAEYPTLVEVDNFNGSVRIVVDEAREPAVWARVRREGPEAPRRRAELQELVDVEAVSEMRDGARLLRVVTRPVPEAEDIFVDVTVRIARSAGTAVRNSGGRVELVNVGGSVHVENGIGGAPGGDVIVRTGRAMTAPVYLESTNGSVLYQVGPGSRGLFDLRSERGKAEFSSRVGRVDQVRFERDRWRGVFNGGTNEIVLRGEGTVRVSVIENAGSYVPARLAGAPAADD